MSASTIPAKSGEWYVEIVQRSTSERIKIMGPMSSEKADKVERGLKINMGPDYYTRQTMTPKVPS